MTDTIAAIASGLSPSGIGIIRISGDCAIQIADKIFRNPSGSKLSDANSHTAHYGFVYDGDIKIDEVICIVFKAPHSFTVEDTVEIDCHGGVYVCRKVLAAVINAGARLAEPGEFTKRAFLNGRIDLSKAEAIMDLISSKNEMARKSSLDMIGGALSDKIHSNRETILHEVAFIESALDDPEHFDLEGYPDVLKDVVRGTVSNLNKLLASFDSGKLIKEGINTTIVGKPNAGKSSVLNMILMQDRAIVTDIAGTTRDTLSETICFDGITLNLIDTAGIHDTDDLVEQIGVDKAKESICKADLVIFIVDSSKDIEDEDRQIISMLAGKKVIVLVNKSDLDCKVSTCVLQSIFDENNINTTLINTSALKGEGREEFMNAVKDMFFNGEVSFNDEVILSNLRQKENIEQAVSSLLKVEQSINDGMPEDFFTIDLMNAYASLGFVIGEEVDDDLVDKIFSEFCMGK